MTARPDGLLNLAEFPRHGRNLEIAREAGTKQDIPVGFIVILTSDVAAEQQQTDKRSAEYHQMSSDMGGQRFRRIFNVLHDEIEWWQSRLNAISGHDFAD